MTWLQQVKDRQVATDNMFEPIKKYIELLKMYDYELPEIVFVQLEGWFINNLIHLYVNRNAYLSFVS
jgi:hypothetical protein